MTYHNKPILWSFRRCPYAMRARLAIKASGQSVLLREILLRDKPEPFLAASQKGTVPVLVLPDGRVIDESRDVMFWALSQADPEAWLGIYHRDQKTCEDHLDALDNIFKHHLDRYKYATRYEDVDEVIHRTEGASFLQKWDDHLSSHPALSGEKAGILDFATLPFVRQFRIADPMWFDNQNWPHLHKWLQSFLNSERFAQIMEKYQPWNETGEDIDF